MIAFSGIDGAGKSTQINLLTDHLKQTGVKVTYVWTRGGYTGPFNALKSFARSILGKSAIPSGRTERRTRMFSKIWVRNLWLTLAMLDLIIVYGLYLRFLQLSGRTVVADRYLWDTWIDFKLNFPEVAVDNWLLWKLLVRVSPEPDYSFLLLIPVEESLRRSKLKNEPFPDTEAVLRQRIDLYYDISKKTKMHVIQCTKGIADIQQEIMSVILTR